MHDAVCRFPRITLLRRWVNREKPDPLRTPTWNSWYSNRWHASERGGSSARRGDSGQQLPIRFGLGIGKVASGQRGTKQVLIRGFRAAHARALRKRRRADPIQPAACSLRTRTLQVYTVEKDFRETVQRGYRKRNDDPDGRREHILQSPGRLRKGRRLRRKPIRHLKQGDRRRSKAIGDKTGRLKPLAHRSRQA